MGSMGVALLPVDRGPERARHCMDSVQQSESGAAAGLYHQQMVPVPTTTFPTIYDEKPGTAETRVKEGNEARAAAGKSLVSPPPSGRAPPFHWICMGNQLQDFIKPPRI